MRLRLVGRGYSAKTTRHDNSLPEPQTKSSRAGSCHLSRLVLTCFDDSLQGSAGKWIQELREQGDRAVPVITGYLVDEVDNTKSGLYCWLVWTVLRPLT